jgi:uncharacterized protein involved in exopolysaccharide biosynthesis
MSSEQNELDMPQESLGVAGIYYVLFRRKWVILGGFLLGLVAAAGLYKVRAPLFQSTAKIMVKYVRDSRALNVDPASQDRSPITGSGSVLPTEGELLTSLDVAQETAEAVGIQRVVPGATNPAAAGFFVKSHVKVTISPQLDVITLQAQHNSPEVAQDILKQLIKAYMQKHDAVHGGIGGTAEALSKQRDQYRIAITNADAAIKVLKDSVGVFSIEEFKKTSADEESKLRQALNSTEADLAQKQAMLNQLQSSTATSAKGGTNRTAVRPRDEPPPSAVAREYASVLASIEKAQQYAAQLALTLTPSSPLTQANSNRLDAAEKRREQLEKEYPALLETPVTPAAALIAPPPVNPELDIRTQAALIPGLEARLQTLTRMLNDVQSKAKAVEAVEPQIVKLRRERDRFETLLTSIDAALQQRQLEQQMGTANIQGVQSPSIAVRDLMDLYKKMALALLFGIALGVGFAFFLELVVDQTLRRPQDMQKLPGTDYFLTIPSLRSSSDNLLAFDETHGKAVVKKGQGPNTPPKPDDVMQPYHEALRDRLVNYFEVRQMNHKPKMIALTSCHEGAGVSSVAVGLAASLSEIGDGNVLLVDMRGSAAHAFFDGKAACDLEQALGDEARIGALVQQRLYVVSGRAAQGSIERLSPRNFGEVVPKLKASDYEYIIFDMPPVSQTSVTPKVARFMDMNLMVIEAGKTSKEVATRASALLAESRAAVGTILNKRRRFVPQWLLQEFD